MKPFLSTGIIHVYLHFDNDIKKDQYRKCLIRYENDYYKNSQRLVSHTHTHTRVRAQAQSRRERKNRERENVTEKKQQKPLLTDRGRRCLWQ